LLPMKNARYGFLVPSAEHDCRAAKAVGNFAVLAKW
jgi:hypothetical protein